MIARLAAAFLIVGLAGLSPLFALQSVYAQVDSPDHWSHEFFVRGMNSFVYALCEYNENLIAAGIFTSATDVSASRIAEWDGDRWTTLSTGVNGTVLRLLAHDGLLYVGGRFTEAGGKPAARIAIWDGASWFSLGAGLDHTVRDMVIFNDTLTVATDRWVYQWHGGDWHSMGEPLRITSRPSALLVLENTLILGGLGTHEGPVIQNAAIWDGDGWSPLGTNLYGTVETLASYEGRIVVGGDLRLEGEDHLVAAWTGTKWEPLTGGDMHNSGHPARVLELYSQGDQLLAGGEFTNPAGDPVNIARWTGEGWERAVPLYEGRVTSMAEFRGEFIVGGDFTRAGTPWEFVLAYNIAAWDGMHWKDLSPPRWSWLR